MEPTLKSLLSELKRKGYEVKRFKGRVNGTAAFTVRGKGGLFTKHWLMKLAGY